MTYVALDIEKTGCMHYKHPVVSIGYCVGDGQGNIYTKNKFNLTVNWPTINNDNIIDFGDFEPRSWKEFWMKQDNKLIDELKKDTVTQAIGFQAFNMLLKNLEEKYGELIFLSDNLSFDIACLDINLERYCNRRPLRYSSFSDNYQSVLPADDLLYSLPQEIIKEATEKFITPYVKHDHDPMNDAEYIYRQYIAYKFSH